MLSVEQRNLRVQVDSGVAPATESFYSGSRPSNDGAARSGLSRAKSLYSMASLVSEVSSELDAEESDPDLSSRHVVQREDLKSLNSSSFRAALEPYLRRARENRQRSHTSDTGGVHLSIAEPIRVPYMPLRHERPFLFDGHTYPLREALAEALQVECLTQLHLKPHDDILKSLLEPERLRIFHAAYDSFVTTFILPLCHSLAIAKNVLHMYSTEKIHYRFQAFPTIRIVRPGDKTSPPTCGLAEGYSIACLQFHVPLTPAIDSNALFTESHPGREDWHALTAKSFGLGYMFDGTRCLHFDLGNSSDCSRVSMDFRVMLHLGYRGNQHLNHRLGELPSLEQLEDRFSSQEGVNHYDEAVIDLSRPGIIAKTNRDKTLSEPYLRSSILLGSSMTN